MEDDQLILNRTEFIHLMNGAIKKYKLVYIGTHTGWGKTTAVMQWLKQSNKKYIYISAENLNENMQLSHQNNNTVIVLDDIHTVKEVEQQEKLLQFIATSSNKFIIIGRTQKIAFLKSFEITMQMISFDEKELALNSSEIEELLKQNEIPFTPQMLQRICEVTQGWIISLMLFIKKFNQGKPLSEDTINEVKYELFDYFDFKLFQRWDSETQNFLMAVSNFDFFDEQMASMITGKNNIITVINNILQIGSFLNFTPPDTYYLQPFMREYLQKKQKELCSKEWINRKIENAGLYYALKGDLASAIECYYKSEDTDKVAELLIENSKKHAGNAQFYDAERYYMCLPEEIIKKSPELMSGMSMLHSLFCRPEDSEKWFQDLVSFKQMLNKSDPRYKIAREKIAYLNITLPHRGSKEMSEIIKNTAVFCITGGLKLQEISVTGNMPSLLNGGKDFCEWLNNDRLLYGLLKKPVEIALGKCGVGLSDIAMGESYFEKNTDGNYTEALMRLNNGLSEATAKGTAQMQFAATGIMARLFAAQGSMDTAIQIVYNFRQKISDTDDSYLLPNIDAFLIRQQLKLNKLNDVEIWMNEKSPNEHKSFYILNRYMYLTKIRCYIGREQYLESLSLLNKLQYYYKTYQRSYGEIETKLLLAITLFHMDDNQWKKALDKVLVQCEKFGLIRIIADEGIAIYPLLVKCKSSCSPEFYKVVLSSVKKQAKLYPDYLKPIQKIDVDLTAIELDVLRLLSRGLKNNEIAGLMNLSVNTIKSHLKNIFSKLQVSNRAQAIKIANEQGLL